MATATEAKTKPGPAATDGAANHRSTSTNKGDSKDYYGYLFEDNKTPTKILDTLLRAIAKYIVRSALSLPELRCLFACPVVVGPVYQDQVRPPGPSMLTPAVRLL